MNSPAPEKSRLERLLDAGVYAPLGYVLRRDEVRDDLARVGRKQVAFARSLGRAALKNVNRGVQAAKTSGKVATPTSSATSADASVAEPVVAPSVEPVVEAATVSAEIDGYGDMTAKHIIGLLSSASVEQAQWVYDSETAGKSRVTVLRAATARLDLDE